MLLVVSIVIFAYVCGSIPFGKIISSQYGVDIQKRGSGNIGFANVLRVLGWKAAIPVLFLDVTKGIAPTLLAVHLLGTNLAFIAGIFAVIGHLFPIWLRFKGGKGVATSLGVLLGITPIVGLSGFVVYVLGTLLLKNSSYASITAGVSVIVIGALLYPAFIWGYVTLLLIALWALRKNLFGTVPNYDI